MSLNVAVNLYISLTTVPELCQKITSYVNTIFDLLRFYCEQSKTMTK